MTELLIATHNPGKFREYATLLKDLPLRLTSLKEKRIDLAIEEGRNTYGENAILKARTYTQATGLLTLADDSGLEVEALGGEPGVLTSRYGGDGLSEEERYTLLLQRMEGIPWERRKALFRCVIAVATPEGEVATAEGRCRGLIALSPKGEGGFGYDPIFYLPQYGRTMAQLEPGVKNEISHRAQAVKGIKKFLRKFL